MKKAFTLIELLVVIAIIAILAAILFPVFAQAKSAAKKTQSLSNIKEVGLGTLMYSNDFDDTFPLVRASVHKADGSWDHDQYWPTLIYPYIKSGNTNDGTLSNFKTSTGEVVGGGVYQSPSDSGTQINGSYGANIFVLGGDLGISSRSATTVDAPTDKILYVERGESDGQAGWDYLDPFQYTWCNSLSPDANGVPTVGTSVNYAIANGDCDNAKVSGNNGYSWNNCSMLPRYRFNGTTVSAFVDGHAGSFKRTGKGAVGSSTLDWYKNLFVAGAGITPY